MSGGAQHVERYFPEAPRAVIALGTDYPDGHVIPPHSHRRCQLLYGSSGVVIVSTAQGAWVMPPQRGMWIPAGTVHDVRILGPVGMRSLYFEPDAVPAMPGRCEVVGISPFMRALMVEAATALPGGCEVDARAEALMALILLEIRGLPALPLSLPFPAHGALNARCRGFLRQPSPHDTIEGWSIALAMSRRSFTRLFRQQTGLSFVAWRQQACLMAALPRLAAGQSVTMVALDLGYNNPAAFTTMFQRLLGSPPQAYFRHGGTATPAASGRDSRAPATR